MGTKRKDNDAIVSVDSSVVIKNQSSDFGFAIFDIEKRSISSVSGFMPPEAINSIKNYGCLVPPIKKMFHEVVERSNSTHKACLDIKSIATSQKGIQSVFGNKRVKALIDRPNYNAFNSFQEIVDAFVYDYYVFDEAYVEIVSIAGSVSIFHIPSKNVYVKIDKNGRVIKYCCLYQDGSVIEYEPYFGGSLENGVRYIAGFKNYNIKSYYYGYPSYFSALEHMMENSYIKQFGISFFSNNATPNKYLAITGGSITDETRKQLQKHMRDNHKGVENANKLLIITVNDSDSKIDFGDVSSRIDVSFLEHYKNNRDEIATVHQIPPKLLGITAGSGLSSGSETIGSLRDFIERSIAPKQNKIEMFLSILLSEVFNTSAKIKLNVVDTTNKKDEAVVNKILSTIVDADGKPVKTATELREEYGMPENPKGSLHNGGKQDSKSEGRVDGVNLHQDPDSIDGDRRV